MSYADRLLLKLFFVFTCGFFILSFIIGFKLTTEQQFSFYADSIVHGKLYLLEKPLTWFDCVKVNSFYYWPLGPFPAFFLVPFVFISRLFGFMFYQGYIQPFLVLGIFLLAFLFAKKNKLNKLSSMALAFGFTFSSVFIIAAIIPWSWYFSHVIAVLLSFLALYEWFFGKKRYILLGFLIGFVFMTRFPAGLLGIFFVLSIIFDSSPWKEKLSDLVLFGTPIIFCGLILMYMNWLRFGNPLDTGYDQVNAFILNDRERYELVNYGLFKIRNIPTNFYYYFLKGLDPVRENVKVFQDKTTHILKFPYITLTYPGTSFFVVSPMFLWLFLFLGGKVKITREISFLFVSIALTLLLLLMYFWSGWRQVGPRYTIDFLPALFVALILLLKQLHHISKGFYLVVMLSSFLNLYLLVVAFSI